MIVSPVMGFIFQKIRTLMKAKEFNYSVGFNLYSMLREYRAIKGILERRGYSQEIERTVLINDGEVNYSVQSP